MIHLKIFCLLGFTMCLDVKLLFARTTVINWRVNDVPNDYHVY